MIKEQDVKRSGGGRDERAQTVTAREWCLYSI